MNQALVGDQETNEKEKYEVKETSPALGDHIFYTDIHWYKFFIRNCHNSKECVVQQTPLSFNVVPNFLYKLYFTLLGNWGMSYKVIAGPLWNMGLRLLFLIIFAGEAFMFILSEKGEDDTQFTLSWEYTSGVMRISHIALAGVYLLMSIPCLILRHNAILEVKKNDNKLSYDDQISRMFGVNRCDAVSLNKVAGKSIRRIMNYKPIYVEICDEAHFSLTSCFSFLNWQFYFMPLYQAGIMGFWLYCYFQYGWVTKELQTK